MSKLQHKYVATRPAPTGTARQLGPQRTFAHRPVHPRSTAGTLLRRLIFGGMAIVALGLLAGLGYKLYVANQTASLIYSFDDPRLPHNHVAMVFGAGLRQDGSPSPMLYDRVATAAVLYKGKRVDKLLMTGDNGEQDYNEVEAMRKTAVDLGVADRDIVLDYAGFNTWDSCYRAREVFGLEEATLVTQRFHLPRALHACNYLQVKSVGVAADRQPYDTFSNELREFPALLANGFRIFINDQPRFLGPQVDIDAAQER